MTEKAGLVRDIRARLPFVAVGHPDLAAAIAHAMDVVEETDAADEDWLAYALTHGPELRRLFHPSKVNEAIEVGSLVRRDGRLGVVVEVQKEADEGFTGPRLIVYDGGEYPAGWARSALVLETTR